MSAAVSIKNVRFFNASLSIRRKLFWAASFPSGAVRMHTVLCTAWPDFRIFDGTSRYDFGSDHVIVIVNDNAVGLLSHRGLILELVRIKSNVTRSNTTN